MQPRQVNNILLKKLFKFYLFKSRVCKNLRENSLINSWAQTLHLDIKKGRPNIMLFHKLAQTKTAQIPYLH